jgi:CubicO group peptidase (beta-lactamase class C family)
MNIARSLTALCSAIMLVSCVTASRETEKELRGQITAGKPILEGALLPVMERNHVPAVSIAVIHGGAIDWAKGYGVREAGSADHVTDETLFQAASISKPVTAAAGLWTTPTDLARFATGIRRSYQGAPEALLSQEMAKEMLTRQVGDYGLGFSVPAAGVPRFQHGGSNIGFICFLVLSVESGDGVVIMTNGDSGGALINVIFPAITAAYGWRV